jgi:hypothetical protein
LVNALGWKMIPTRAMLSRVMVASGSGNCLG